MLEYVKNYYVECTDAVLICQTPNGHVFKIYLPKEAYEELGLDYGLQFDDTEVGFSEITSEPKESEQTASANEDEAVQ